MTSSITPLVAMQGTLEKMADKFTEALPRQMDVNKFISDTSKLSSNDLCITFSSKNKEIIEKKYGADLNWQGEDNYRRCQVTFKVEDLGYDTNNWDKKMNLLIDNLIRFDLSLKDVLDLK